MHTSGGSTLSEDNRLESLKIIAHPVRLKILKELIHGVKCVNDFRDFLEISQPNVSQHLSLLRRHGLIDYFSDGRLRCYFVTHPMVPDLIAVISREYKTALSRPNCCISDKKGRYPGGGSR